MKRIVLKKRVQRIRRKLKYIGIDISDLTNGRNDDRLGKTA